MYTTYTAQNTIPSVYTDDAPDALSDVAAYRNPFPTSSAPNLLSGLRHHRCSPTATYDATTRARQIATDLGSVRIGLFATAQAVRAVATIPATPTRTNTSARGAARRPASRREDDVMATEIQTRRILRADRIAVNRRTSPPHVLRGSTRQNASRSKHPLRAQPLAASFGTRRSTADPPRWGHLVVNPLRPMRCSSSDSEAEMVRRGERALAGIPNRRR